MAEKTEPKADGQSPEGGNSASRKLAGKYDSVEDLEKGYGEINKYAQQMAAKFDQLEKRLEESEQRWVTVQATNQRGEVTTQDPQAATVAFLEKFYSNPSGIFDEVKQEAYQKADEAATVKYLALRAYDKFIDKNADLAEHEQLFQSAIGQLDSRLPLKAKLEKAAELTRNQVLKIRQGSTAQPGQLNADAYVESPSGSGAAVPKADAASNADDDLADYLNQRRATLAKKIS